ncbi:MAG: DUF4843 domain-containing protein [Bacteroidales bacterium]
MKKRIYPIIALIFVVALSCEKDEIATFNTGDAGVLFPGLGDGKDYKGYNTTDRTYYINETFIDKPFSQESFIVDFPIRVSGIEEQFDRVVNWQVTESNTTAQTPAQYTIVEAKIPAGQRYGYIRFELYRDPSLDDAMVQVAVELKESDHLKIGSNEYKRGVLTWSNMLPMFPASANYIRTYNMILLSPLAKTSAVNDYYSPNAHKAMLDALGWEVGYWPRYNNGAADPGTGVSTLFGAYYSDLYARKLQAYLENYALQNGGERLKHNGGLADGVAIQARLTGAVYNPNL